MAIKVSKKERDDSYSDKIRLCTGTKGGGQGEEPPPYAWGDDASMSEGHGTFHKLYFFTLKNGYHFKEGGRPVDYTSPDEICPVDIFHAEGFPVKMERLTDIDGNDENGWYKRFHYLGNGTLQHERGSEIWIYDAEFSSNSFDFEDDDKTVEDENTEPWNKKPWNVSLDFPEVVKPFRYAYVGKHRFDDDGNPKRTVVNAAGDRIMAETTEFMLQLSFTYALKPRSDIDITTIRKAQGSINEDGITLCGLYIPAGQGRIISMKPQLICESTDDSGYKNKSYWEISATVQILTDDTDTFNQKLYNIGDRALFNPNAYVSNSGVVHGNTYSSDTALYKSSIYQWWPFTSSEGQAATGGVPQFGSRKLLRTAQAAFNKLCGDSFGTFAFEEMHDMPLTRQGMIDTDALSSTSDRFGQYRTLEFQEFKKMDWRKNSIFKQVSGSGGKLKW